MTRSMNVLHLLGRLGARGLALHGVDGQQVLSHECSLRWCGSVPALTLPTNGSGHEDTPRQEYSQD